MHDSFVACFRDRISREKVLEKDGLWACLQGMKFNFQQFATPYPVFGTRGKVINKKLWELKSGTNCLKRTKCLA